MFSNEDTLLCSHIQTEMAEQMLKVVAGGDEALFKQLGSGECCHNMVYIYII